MRRRRFLSGAAAGSLAGLAGCGDVLGSDGRSGPAGPPRLSVDGRWLTDPSGGRVVLRGVNVPGPVWGRERADARGKGYRETLELATDAGAGWHSRVLRVPATPQTLANVGVERFANEYLDEAVALAAERGVYLLIDYHATERYDTDAIDDRLRTFWRTVAPRYADESHVLYELFNEPTEPATGGIEAWRTWTEYAEPWVRFVRERAPETPVVVGSPRWSSLTAYAAEEPFADDNVVYSAHVYPSWEPETWEATFGDPALSVPVFVTEWGYADDANVDSHFAATTGSWGRPFREWLASHDNVGWCARAFDSQWVPPMFDAEWNLRGGDRYMGELVKRWLAAERERHWPPAGADAPTATATPTGRPPGAPESLGLSSIGETAATLVWVAPTDSGGDDVVQYRIALGDDDPRVLRGSRQSYELTGLNPGERYAVSATAVDGAGRESRPATAEFTTAASAEAAATIPAAGDAPAVDRSVEDAWADTPPHPIDTRVWAEQASDVTGEWRALWDGRALYVLVTVADEAVLDHDAVELYLDLAHDGGDEYDGVDDLQLVVEAGSGRLTPGANSATVDPVDATVTETGDGWRAEIAVPWEPYGVAPFVGDRLGMDVHVVDDAEGGIRRDAKVAWYDESDAVWETPSAMATVALGR
ncbi:carbohydrate-binding protein [Halosimplex carlsbadense 2-9-1]|uniref:Carbohydrate-binding protein n=1 Tax=Halosimplex carlsbadense 2-9-1 TaxID=797114 RepID=M0D192_9EURY|nr:cellulase family glycosylhydrolase [Halosimplex carlsbadense]ELZ29281.1 carbohydrate-binding protein [Halosimplex carlsbadense 2-9-1]